MSQGIDPSKVPPDSGGPSSKDAMETDWTETNDEQKASIWDINESGEAAAKHEDMCDSSEEKTDAKEQEDINNNADDTESMSDSSEQQEGSTVDSGGDVGGSHCWVFITAYCFDHHCSHSLFYLQDTFEDPHKPSPSPVVHVRGLSEPVSEPELMSALQNFGHIK